jgi:FAD/FMN-containing dehydrogenase/Fe-S oxidoreductase
LHSTLYVLPLRVIPANPDRVDAELETDLRRHIRGEVRFAPGDRALYATDASNYRQVPIGVVIPRTVEDVIGTLEACRTHRAPVLARGGGTSIAGQCCNTAVVIDTSKHLDRILEIDGATRTARVQPGVTLDHLRTAASRQGLTFGPDPGTHRSCTLGGMIGNNSCGVHSIQSAFEGTGPATADNIASLDIVTYRGLRLRLGPTSDDEYRRISAGAGPVADLYRRLKAFQERYAAAIRREFPDIPRRVSGYNLPALLPENGFDLARAVVGSESTLVFVLEATTHLVRHYSHRVLVILGFPDIFAAADAVPPLLEFRPIGLEAIDEMLVREDLRSGVPSSRLRLLPEGRGWLLLEFGGDTPAEARERADAMVAFVRRGASAPQIRLLDDPADQEAIWQLREGGAPAVPEERDAPAMWPGWDDSAVAPDKLGAYLRELHALYDRYHYAADLFGHFGQGCVHCRVAFDLVTPDGIAQFRSFMQEAADLVHRYGGSLSGEHGDGQARGELLTRMFSGEMVQAFREFKSIWDPDWLMNPGKIVDANRMDANLRLSGNGVPAPPSTYFQFPQEPHGFASASLRCVGTGYCRKDEAGTMCPSYMVTREERHATRGRARLLYEMLRGDTIADGWASREVFDALDLCLSCKGCKGDCPVHVDMATYKAEFLAHYYEHHARPRSAFAFGLIDRWAALASYVPGLVNLFTQTPGLSAIAKVMTGMPQARRVPAFAPFTFRTWFETRERNRATDRTVGGTELSEVVLWPDTFNNHFHPRTAIAAVHALEDAGFTVTLPRERLCCGRPLYDYGMLASARSYLRRILNVLADDIDRGIPLVVLEPSCLAVFRDELPNLLPDHPRGARLRTLACSLGEFLSRHADRVQPLSLRRTAVLHGHCHQNALGGTEGDQAVLRRLGVEVTPLDGGCCGMAGSFGFEARHYEVSQAVGERRLLPAVRRAPLDALIVADGFSCREQIAGATNRRALHLADVIALARQRTADVPAFFPERPRVTAPATLNVAAAAGVAVAVAGAALLGYQAWRRTR